MQFNRITHNPAVMGGKPCIRGLRITVGTVVGLLASGQTRERILQAYPYLETGDLDEALAYAARRLQEREEQFVTLSNTTAGPAPKGPVLAGDQVLAIAQADAVKAYRDLSGYRIQVVLEGDGWHVDYELKDPRLKGGGPHYVIDAQTGTIVSKKYEQ